MQGLEGKVAVVTGGSRGIGSAICEGLAAAGAKVVVNYARSADKAEALAAKIGAGAIAKGFDVSSEEAVTTAFKEIAEELGSLDVLVNNAGIAIDGLLLRTKSEDWQNTISTNLSSCFFCSKAAAKTMMKARWGRIINVSSVVGEMGNAGQVAYAASKSGIFGLTKSLSKELGSRGVTVNAITPGYIKTDMTDAMSEENREQLQSQIPLNRLGNPEDVANLVSFLASDLSSYITGQIIGINGGLYM